MAIAKSKGADRKAFLEAVKTKNAGLKKAGKEKAPSGYASNADLIQAFNLKAGSSASCKAKLVSINYGLTDPKPKPGQKGKGIGKKAREPYIAFNFALLGSQKGMMVSIFINLVASGNRTEEMINKSLCFTLQRLGFETDDISFDALVKIADEYTETDEKVICQLSIRCTKSDDKNNPFVNINVQRKIEEDDEEEEEDDEDDSSDDEEDEDEEEDDDEDEDDEESEDEDEDEDDEEDEDEDSDEDEDEDDEDEEDDEDDFDADDPATWVGHTCKAKPAGTSKKATYEITKYIAKGKKLKIKNKAGKEFTVSALTVENVS